MHDKIVPGLLSKLLWGISASIDLGPTVLAHKSQYLLYSMPKCKLIQCKVDFPIIAPGFQSQYALGAGLGFDLVVLSFNLHFFPHFHFGSFTFY